MMKPNRNDRGSAVLAVFFILVLFSVLGMAAVSLISGSAGMLTDEIKSQQAFDLATAGLAYEAGQLKDDTDWSDNTGYSKNLGQGSFTVSYVVQTTDTATVRSDGTVGGIARAVQQDFEGGGGGLAAFDNALYTEGSIIVKGSAEGDIYGPSSAGDIIDDDGDVVFHEDPDDKNPDAEVPEPVLPYWESSANVVIDGNYNFSSGTYSGIYYVKGNVTFSSDVAFNGTIVSEGSLTASGNSNITITAVPATNPVIISVGTVLFTGCSGLTINGFVICLSNVVLTGNMDVELNGGLVAEDDITMTGNVDVEVTFDAGYSPDGDGFTGGEDSGGVIGESNWQEVF